MSTASAWECISSLNYYCYNQPLQTGQTLRFYSPTLRALPYPKPTQTALKPFPLYSQSWLTTELQHQPHFGPADASSFALVVRTVWARLMAKAGLTLPGDKAHSCFSCWGHANTCLLPQSCLWDLSRTPLPRGQAAVTFVAGSSFSRPLAEALKIRD